MVLPVIKAIKIERCFLGIRLVYRGCTQRLLGRADASEGSLSKQVLVFLTSHDVRRWAAAGSIQWLNVVRAGVSVTLLSRPLRLHVGRCSFHIAYPTSHIDLF